MNIYSTVHVSQAAHAIPVSPEHAHAAMRCLMLLAGPIIFKDDRHLHRPACHMHLSAAACSTDTTGHRWLFIFIHHQPL